MEYGAFARLFVILVATWPLQAQAECSLSELNSMRSSSVVGIADKYRGADQFLLVAKVGPAAPLKEGLVPEVLRQENIVQTAKKFLEERMLPCIKNQQIDVIGEEHDERLTQKNSLVAYVEVTYGYGESHPDVIKGISLPDYVLVRSGYFRSPPYSALQVFNGHSQILFVHRGSDELQKKLEEVIRIGLSPEWKYKEWE